MRGRHLAMLTIYQDIHLARFITRWAFLRTIDQDHARKVFSYADNILGNYEQYGFTLRYAKILGHLAMLTMSSNNR